MVVVGRGRFFWPVVAVVVVARDVLVVVSRRLMGAPVRVVLVVTTRFVVIVLVRVVLGHGALALALAVVVVTSPCSPVFTRCTTPVAPGLKPEVVVLDLVKRVVPGERARGLGKTFFGRSGVIGSRGVEGSVPLGPPPISRSGAQLCPMAGRRRGRYRPWRSSNGRYGAGGGGGDCQ